MARYRNIEPLALNEVEVFEDNNDTEVVEEIQTTE